MLSIEETTTTLPTSLKKNVRLPLVESNSNLDSTMNEEQNPLLEASEREDSFESSPRKVTMTKLQQTKSADLKR